MAAEACVDPTDLYNWPLQEMLGYASLPTTTVIATTRMSGIISTGSHVSCYQYIWLPSPHSRK